MKHKLIKLLILLLTISVLLSGCNYVNFNQQLNSAKEYNVKITFKYNNNPNVYLTCTYDNGKYAYKFSTNKNFDLVSLSYRQIFVDNKMYEVEEASLIISVGQYKVTENVSATSDKNFIYKYFNLINQTIILTDFAKSNDETLGEKIYHKYAVSYDSKDMTYYFDPETKLISRFICIDGENTYDLTYDNFVFEDVKKDDLNLPINSSLYKKTDNLMYQYFIS